MGSISLLQSIIHPFFKVLTLIINQRGAIIRHLMQISEGHVGRNFRHVNYTPPAVQDF